MIYGAAAERNRTHTPGASYTERSDLRQGSGGDIAATATEDRSVLSASTVAVDGTFSGAVDWAVVGAEIKAGGGAANAAPVASNLLITGNAQVGQVLPGEYTYTDGEGDLQGVSTFRWLRDKVAIAGATAQTYPLVAADQGTMVSFEITPVAQTGTSPGVPVVSAAVGPVAAGGGTNGPVLHEETRTGASSGLSSVTTTTALTGVAGHLYLAASSTLPNVTVSGVSAWASPGRKWQPSARAAVSHA